MAVEFKKFTQSDSALTDEGTLKAIVGKGGKIALIRKNWEDKTKRVAVLLTNKAGNSAVVACSKQVSDALRNGKLNIAQLVGLSVVSNEEGHNFVSMPAAGAIKEIAIDSVKEEKFETEVEALDPHSLVAF
jgi:hypothetical protein